MRSKFLSREDVERAQKYTKSNKAAARFLGCSYTHYQMYAKLYKDVPSGSKGIVQKAWIKYLQDTIKDWDPALARLIDTYFMNDTLKETIVQTAKENK